MSRCPAWSRASLLTCLVLAAALARGLVPPSATGGALLFATCLAAIWAASNRERWSGRSRDEDRWQVVPALLLGGLVAGLLLAPNLFGASPGRALTGLLPWSIGVGTVATSEEVVIRGPVQSAWCQAAGLPVALLASASVFTAVHLPTYGVSALPVDFAAGLALAGLRAVTGRVLPCVFAHSAADWGAWFWS